MLTSRRRGVIVQLRYDTMLEYLTYIRNMATSQLMYRT